MALKLKKKKKKDCQGEVSLALAPRASQNAFQALDMNWNGKMSSGSTGSDSVEN